MSADKNDGFFAGRPWRRPSADRCRVHRRQCNTLRLWEAGCFPIKVRNKSERNTTISNQPFPDFPSTTVLNLILFFVFPSPHVNVCACSYKGMAAVPDIARNLNRSVVGYHAAELVRVSASVSRHKANNLF